jgi:hypothetical protein
MTKSCKDRGGGGRVPNHKMTIMTNLELKIEWRRFKMTRRTS